MRRRMFDEMYVASILFALAGIAVEVYAVWHASRVDEDLSFSLLGLGIALLCTGLVLVTLEAGGLLQSGQ